MKSLHRFRPFENCRFYMWYCLVFLLMLFPSCRADDDPVDDPVDLNPYVYVANENGQSISVIDVNKMIKVIDIDVSDTAVSMAMPHNVQVAPDGQSVWATSMGMDERDNESLVVIDPHTNSVVHRIYIGQDLHLAHVVLDDQSARAYVTAFHANKVFQVDAKSYTVLGSFDLDSIDGPHGMRYASGKLFVANMNSNSMSIIDVASGGITKVALGGIAVQTAVTPDGKYAFASLFDTKEVARYEIATGDLRKIALPSSSLGPIQLYPTPDSKYLYVCDQGALLGRPSSNKVFVLDIVAAAVVATIQVGHKAHGVVISHDGRYAFVTNTDDNTICMIQTSSRKVVATIPAGLAPNGIAYGYGGGGMP